MSPDNYDIKPTIAVRIMIASPSAIIVAISIHPAWCPRKPASTNVPFQTRIPDAALTCEGQFVYRAPVTGIVQLRTVLLVETALKFVHHGSKMIRGT